jgi:hypothetical protein
MWLDLGLIARDYEKQGEPHNFLGALPFHCRLRSHRIAKHHYSSAYLLLPTTTDSFSTGNPLAFSTFPCLLH